MGSKKPIRHPVIVIFGISVSYFLACFDTTAFNLALVTIQQDLQLSLTQVDWVMISMLIAMGTLLGPAGKISDKYGHRGPMLIGLFFFSLVSIFGGFVVNATQLIAMRFLQGASAALFWPGLQALSIIAVKEQKRTLAVGFTQFSSALGISSGPLIAGYLLLYLSWRWIFWVTIPFALISLSIFLLFIPENAFFKHDKKINLISSTLLCFGVFTGIHALDLLGKYGFTNLHSSLWSVIAISCFILFAFSEDVSEEPLIEREVLENRCFRIGICMRAVTSSTYYSFIFLLGFALQHIGLMGPQLAGYYFLPLTLGLMVFSLATSYFVKFIALHKIMFFSFFLLGLSCIIFALTARVTLAFWALTPSLILIGVSYGMFTPTNSIFMIAPLSKKITGLGSGLLMMIVMISAPIGIVMASILLRTVGVKVALNQILQQGITLTESQVIVIKRTMLGTVSTTEALTYFRSKESIIYQALSNGFFTAMFWDLFLFAALVLLGLIAFAPRKYHKC